MSVELKQNRLQQDLNYLTASIKTWAFWKTLLLMAIGSGVIGAAVNGLLVQARLFDGGVSGISLMIFYLTDRPPLGVIFFCLNVPIFLVCWREMSLKFVVISLIGVFFLSTSFYLTQHVSFQVSDPIMVPVLAGIIIGAGTGIYVRVGGSCGGLDMLAQVLKKRLSIPMGHTFITFNAIPLLGALLIYNLDIALYTGIYMFVQAVVLERVQTGFSQRKAVFIVSHKPDEIAEQVMKRLDRGVTFFHASGGWEKKEQRVIYTVINMRELGRLKEWLFQTDPEAFVAISNTAEVIGRRFLSWEDEGFTPMEKGRIKAESPVKKSR
jgi:uncharacterized membrane-anchored protein YitT (DUF2179 family)